MSTADQSPAQVSAAAERQRPAGMRSMLVIALMLHIPLFIYPVLRICGWLDIGAVPTLCVLLPVVSSQTLSRWLMRDAKHSVVRGLRHIADFILGMSPIVLLILLVMEVIVLVGLVDVVTAAYVTIVVACLVSGFGLLMASIPVVKEIRFQTASLKAPVRFVQITDVHIGSRSEKFLSQIVNKIDALSPEFLCITGDFIDAGGITEEQLSSLKTLSCPIYFSIGNHERYEDLPQIIQRLENLGVQVLRSQAVFHRADLQVLGIDDREDALQVERELRNIPVSPEAFNLLLYHRPTGLAAAERAGIDLTISGHTHNGQIFPFNLIVSRYFDRIEGMYQQGASRQYVSQGTGTWGPVMRVGTRSEITLFCLDVERSG